MRPREEGWYTDPYDRHQHRWLSDGKATNLVRDDGVESRDQPPDEMPSRLPQQVRHTARRGGADLLRADDAEGDGSEMDHDAVYMRQMDAVWSNGAPPFDRIAKGETY